MNARTDTGPALAAALPPLGQPGRRVAVEDLLPALVADGLLAADDAEAVDRYARLSNADQHALVALARRKLKSPG
ncbi:MAG TPA: type II/IV secretion system protein, partial [Burkholderiaceae bacterium]|nr:type II/IV secretion system protein [Burkholderiaceae bacterium]